MATLTKPDCTGDWRQRDALGGFNGSDLNFHGGYLFASYFLTSEHIPLKRTSGTIDRVKPFHLLKESMATSVSWAFDT